MDLPQEFPRGSSLQLQLLELVRDCPSALLRPPENFPGQI
jgi:hypothetical protein